MRDISTIDAEELELMIDATARQLNAGIKKDLVISNIEDQYVGRAAALEIAAAANKRQQEQLTKEKAAKKHRLPLSEKLLPLLVGTFCAVVGGSVWAAIVILSGSQYFFLVPFIGLLAGTGTYELAKRKGRCIYRVLSALACILGVTAGRLIVFSYYNLNNEFSLNQYFNDFISYLISVSDPVDAVLFAIALLIASVAIPSNYGLSSTVKLASFMDFRK
jgi:hypothetical protein